MKIWTREDNIKRKKSKISLELINKEIVQKIQIIIKAAVSEHYKFKYFFLIFYSLFKILVIYYLFPIIKILDSLNLINCFEIKDNNSTKYDKARIIYVNYYVINKFLIF